MIQTTNTTICKSWRGRNFVVKIWGGEIDILQSIWVESAILQNKGRKLPMYESLGTKSTNKKTFVAKTWNKKVDFWPNYKNTKLYLLFIRRLLFINNWWCCDFGDYNVVCDPTERYGLVFCQTNCQFFKLFYLRNEFGGCSIGVQALTWSNKWGTRWAKLKDSWFQKRIVGLFPNCIPKMVRS